MKIGQSNSFHPKTKDQVNNSLTKNIGISLRSPLFGYSEGEVQRLKARAKYREDIKQTKVLSRSRTGNRLECVKKLIFENNQRNYDIEGVIKYKQSERNFISPGPILTKVFNDYTTRITSDLRKYLSKLSVND